MDRPLVIQRFLPAKRSTTSDSQVDTGSGTAEMSNLAAIMRNSIVVFEGPQDLVPGTDWTPKEEDTEEGNG